MKKTKKETTLRQQKPGPRAKKADGESAVLANIAAMPGPDRAIGERLHAIIKANAPALSPRLWYGMPAYARDGKVVCFFQPAHKFKTRYATLGFNDSANLDEGGLWPVAFFPVGDPAQSFPYSFSSGSNNLSSFNTSCSCFQRSFPS